MSGKKLKKTISFILSVVIFLFAAWQFITKFMPDIKPTDMGIPANGDGLLSARFLDVDQADCELFTFPDGKTLLVDAGDTGDGETLVKYLKNLNISKIDYLVATHPHADHIGGISNVINEFEIGKIFAPKISKNDTPTSKTYEKFLTSVQNKGLKITIAKGGITLFDGKDYKAECFAPCDTDYENLNDYSVVLKITYGIHSFLLTGDAEQLSENQILSNGYNVDCDVLKVGHHGSSSSSSQSFLKAVSPEYTVISCGSDNSYGHPHRETLTALKNLKSNKQILRTDLDKTIVFIADGKTKDGLRFTTKNKSVIE